MAEDKYKVCFKCGRNLPLSEFYVHKQMRDGHLNKCKECARMDVHENYMENLDSSEFIEKERKRGREKYHRLYKDTKKETRRHSNSYKSWFERRQVLFWQDIELHHWNYDKPHDVFLVSRQHHARIHKLITRGPDDAFFMCDGIPLDTKEKHEEIVKKIAGNEYFFLNEEILEHVLSEKINWH